jgi:hypothetical protein
LGNLSNIITQLYPRRCNYIGFNLLFSVDLLDYGEFILIPERELLVNHAIQSNPQCPNICCLPTETIHISYKTTQLHPLLTVTTLRCHEVVSPFSLADLVIIFLKELAHPEVSQLDFLVIGDENVLGFDISVDYSVDVHYRE